MTSKRQMRLRVARLLGYKVIQVREGITNVKLWALICPNGQYAPPNFKPARFDLSHNIVSRYIYLNHGIDIDRMYTIQK